MSAGPATTRAATEQPPGRLARLRRPSGPTLLVLVAGAVAWAFLLNLHGFWWGRSQPTLMTLHGAGVIQCMRDQGVAALWSVCPALGAPEGLPLLTGLPQLYLGWVVNYLPWVDPWAAHQVSNALVDLVGLVAGYLLLRRWHAPRWIALLTSTAYLASPSMLAMNGFAYTFSGFVLLPAYLLATLVVADLVVRGRVLASVAVALPLALVMVFTDGYSLFAGLLLAGVVLLARCWDADLTWRTRTLLLAVPGASMALSLLAFLVYTPDNVTEIPVGIGAFRYLGLDLATLVLPQDTLWWADLAGFGRLADTLWGDGSNVVANYVGVTTVVLAVVALLVRRGRATVDRRLVLALAVAGALALVLALGPALKIYAETQAITPEWDVPASMTSGDLPTRWLYENVPGFESMRATYRWFLLTRFVLVVLAGLGLTALWRARPARPALARLARPAAVLLALVLVVETAPNVPRTLAATRAYDAHLTALRTTVVADSVALVEPGERILLLPSRNDFLAIGLVPFTGATAYNAAPDKNYQFARSGWPAAVTEAVTSWTDDAERADAVCRVLEDDADAVVLPSVDPYYDAVSWPPDPARVEGYRWVADTLAADDRFVADRLAWVTVLRSSGKAC